jgi:hypothetical protein
MSRQRTRGPPAGGATNPIVQASVLIAANDSDQGKHHSQAARDRRSRWSASYRHDSSDEHASARGALVRALRDAHEPIFGAFVASLDQFAVGVLLVAKAPARVSHRDGENDRTRYRLIRCLSRRNGTLRQD